MIESIKLNSNVTKSNVNFKQNKKATVNNPVQATINSSDKVDNKTLSKAYQAMNGINFTGDVKVTTPSEIDYSKYSKLASEAVDDVKSRAQKNGQFLNWIGELPETQLENIDNIYEKAEEAKKDGKTDIAIMGIGGSRHTTEALVNMLDKNEHAHFYSSVDKESFNRFMDKLDKDKTQFLVVSKSGGTLETTTAYNNAKKYMQEYTGAEDVSDRFFAVTDESGEKSALRRLVQNGELQDAGVVHDDVGGRFSIFDDATIFTLAYLGVEKEDVKDMLKASIEAQNEFLNPNIEENEALQLAVSNVDAKNNGKNKHSVEYFGDAFSGATLWEKQMKNESLKSKISTDTNIGPGYLHYNAEADLDEDNKDSFYTFVHTSPEDDATAKAVVTGVTTAYRKQHPVSEIELEDLKPDTLGRFIELKHFETLYTGNMLRRQNGDVTSKDEPMPEVVQPNVEKYKKEVKKAMN